MKINLINAKQSSSNAAFGMHFDAYLAEIVQFQTFQIHKLRLNLKDGPQSSHIEALTSELYSNTGIHGPKPVGPSKVSKPGTGRNQDRQNFENLGPIPTGLSPELAVFDTVL